MSSCVASDTITIPLIANRNHWPKGQERLVLLANDHQYGGWWQTGWYDTMGRKGTDESLAPRP